jgi:hypothetical protein
MDRDCSVWDRIVSTHINCGDGDVELGRWINAFQRKVGHWLTTVPLMPLFYPHSSEGGRALHAGGATGVGSAGGGAGSSDDTPQFCNVTSGVGMGDHWLSTLNVRFGSGRQGEKQAVFGQPDSVIPLVYVLDHALTILDHALSQLDHALS